MGLATRGRMLQRQPLSIVFAAGDALLDKEHAVDAVVDVRIDGVAASRTSVTGCPRLTMSVVGRIDTRSRTLRKTPSGCPRRQTAGGLPGVVHVRRVRVCGCKSRAGDHSCGWSNMAFGSSCRQLAAPPCVPSISMNRSFSRPCEIWLAVTVPRAPFSKTNDRMAVIVEADVPLSKIFKLTGDSLWEGGPSCIAGEVVRMRADVAERSRPRPTLPGSVRQAACFCS